jgi:hypothetical protein
MAGAITYTVTRRDSRQFATGGGSVSFTVAVGPRGADGAPGAAGPNVVSDTTALGTLTAVTNPLFLLGTNAAGTFARRVTPGAGTGGGLSLLLATDRAAVLALLGTGTPGAGNFLRGDGSWQAVSASPGGSNTQVQFNDGGSFGGDAGLLFNKTTDTLTTSILRATTRVELNYTGQVVFGADGGYNTQPSIRNDGNGQLSIYRNHVENILSWRITGNGPFECYSSTFGGSNPAQAGYLFAAPNTTANADVTLAAWFTGSGLTRPALVVSTPRMVGWAGSSTQQREAVAIGWSLSTSTDATRTGLLTLSAYSTTTAQEGIRVEGNSGGVRLGMYGSAAVERQAVPAALGGGAVLADVITAFNAMRTALITSTMFKA